MEATPPDRPTIICLVALPGARETAPPRLFELINLLELWRWEGRGWVFVAIDPDTLQAWEVWRAAHPNAG